jgi:hypothetical protein
LARAITPSASNGSLHAARAAKNDEFYTQLTDIEKELQHYRAHFEGKVVFCNCDDPEWSNFWKFFTLNFKHFGLKKVVATHYAPGEASYMLEVTGQGLQPVRTPLVGDGDFRSAECVEILKRCDIVVTNPPFSLFREYISQLVEHGKKFLVLGNNNSVTYKEVFKLIRDNEIWLGYGVNKTLEFRLSPHYSKWSRIDRDGHKYGKVPAISWFTNLPHAKRNAGLILFRNYAGHEALYPAYDNYAAIEVSRVADIPQDYAGAMGVPITFLDKYNPEQFEILSANDFRRSDSVPFKEHGLIKDKDGTIDGKAVYVRILVKRKTSAEQEQA